MDGLHEWPEIQRQIERFTHLRDADREARKRLDDEITPMRAEDPTGQTAVTIAERRAALDESIQKWDRKIEEKTRNLQEIELAVAGLPPREQEIIRRFYFNQEHWESVARGVYLSRSRFYELLERSRAKVEYWILNAEE